MRLPPGTRRSLGAFAVGVAVWLFAEHHALSRSDARRFAVAGGPAQARATRDAIALQLRTHGFNRVGDRVLVVARYKEDSSWVDTFFNDMPHVVITPALPGASYTTEKNKGNEAGPFLRYILDHYDHLPKHMAFIHGHRISHHTYQLDIVPVLKAVRWGSRPYLPLNVHMFQRVWNDPRTHPEYEELQRFWPQLFTDLAPEMPREIHTWCCAQFVVTRAAVRGRSRAFYERIYEWMTGPQNITSFTSSRVLEQTWHMIFGEPAIADMVAPCDVFDCDVLDVYSRTLERWEGTPFDRIPCRVYDIADLQDEAARVTPTYAPRAKVWETPSELALEQAARERAERAVALERDRDRDHAERASGSLLSRYWAEGSLLYGYGKPDPPRQFSRSQVWRQNRGDQNGNDNP